MVDAIRFIENSRNALPYNKTQRLIWRRGKHSVRACELKIDDWIITEKTQGKDFKQYENDEHVGVLPW